MNRIISCVPHMLNVLSSLRYVELARYCRVIYAFHVLDHVHGFGLEEDLKRKKMNTRLKPCTGKRISLSRLPLSIIVSNFGMARSFRPNRDFGCCNAAPHALFVFECLKAQLLAILSRRARQAASTA